MISVATPWQEAPRLCLVCRTLKPRKQLHRLTWRGQEQSFWLNAGPNYPGRSVYWCAQNPNCNHQAAKNKGRRLARALKRSLVDAIVQEVEALCLGSLPG